MFARWLALFEATAGELFVQDIAVQFTEKAQRIAFSLQMALFHRLARPAERPAPSAALAGHDVLRD